MDFAIKTKDLGRIYKIRGGKKEDRKELVALADVNLEIKPGELFGLLGPNGAGKTTLIKILTTLLAPTSGEAYATGYDVIKYPEKVRPRINMVSGGESSGYGLLTGMTVVFGVLAFVVFRYCDNRARELGYIDRVTNY